MRHSWRSAARRSRQAQAAVPVVLWQAAYVTDNAETRRWYKARQRELRELLWQWDPLGLMGAPDDEYDALIDGVLSALVNRAESDSVAAAVMSGLDDMAGEGYGAALATRQSESPRLVPFVERVREWWNAVPPQP